MSEDSGAKGIADPYGFIPKYAAIYSDPTLVWLVDAALSEGVPTTIYVETENLRVVGDIGSETSTRWLHLEPCKVLKGNDPIDGGGKEVGFMRILFRDVRTWGVVNVILTEQEREGKCSQ